MPESQANAVTEVTAEAVKDLVTKEYLDHALDKRFAEQRAELREEMQDGIGGLRKEMQDGVGELRKEMQDGVGELRKGMQDGIGELRKEMQAGFADIHKTLSNLVFKLIATFVGLTVAMAAVLGILL